MKTKFVRILSVLLAIAMLAACSVIVSAATESSTSPADGLELVAGDITTKTITDENGDEKEVKIITISLVSKGEVCYNVEGNWGDIVKSNSDATTGFKLNKIEFNNGVVDGLNDLYYSDATTGNAVWVDVDFQNADANATIMTAEYIIPDDVTPGTYKAQFTVAVYTDSGKIPAEYTGGVVVETEFEIEEDVQNITVIAKGTISHTVEGQVVTVTHAVPCKVGYLSGGKYVAITAEHVSGNTYKFTAPDGVAEVLLVVKGDADLNARISVTDKSQVNAAALRKTTFGPEALFAADINSNGRIDVTDKSQVNAVVLRKTTFAW